MRSSDKGLVLRDLDRLFRRGTVSSGDGALLRRFLAEGDESAFEELVARHGPMVLGVCRRLLASPQDADDAFQATFLVLVRKAGRLRDPDRLGPWLYGVATRVAAKARARAARRRHEPLVEVGSLRESRADWLDLMPILDAELGRLPLRQRDVLVMCLLDGASVEEASRRLGCPVGTVKSRLARAREALRSRLTRRGVTPAAALAALHLEHRPPRHRPRCDPLDKAGRAPVHRWAAPAGPGRQRPAGVSPGHGRRLGSFPAEE
jgi:RNA polymerase sigma factor (sigma-70 family)